MVVIAAVHVLVILSVPWREGWVPAPLLIVLCIADAAIILGIISVVQKLVDGTNRTKSSA